MQPPSEKEINEALDISRSKDEESQKPTTVALPLLKMGKEEPVLSLIVSIKEIVDFYTGLNVTKEKMKETLYYASSVFCDQTWYLLY